MMLFWLLFLCLGLLTVARVDLVDKDEFKVSLVVDLLDRILPEASAMSINTYSFVGTNESYFRDVLDRLASRSLAFGSIVPSFNNAMTRHAPSRQLVLVAGDNIDSIMGSLVHVFSRQPIRFFGTNSRNIYVILVLPDLRFIEMNKFFLLRIFFCTLNFLIVAPPPTPLQPPVLLSMDYAGRAVLVEHDAPIDRLFADRFRSEDVPPVIVSGPAFQVYLRQNEQAKRPGADWMLFRTILEHLNLRWNFTLHRKAPSLATTEWVNEQLDRPTMDIYIDRSFLPNDQSVVHFLPEMNGFCMIVPKAKKFEVLRHLLSPMQATCWLVLGGALCVGALVAQRYARSSLLAVLLFGVNLNGRRISRPERVLLFGSLVLFFILSEAYQAKLVSLISTLRYPPDPRTVADFLRTDIKLELGETTATVVSSRRGFAGRVTNLTDYEFTFDGNRQQGVVMSCPSAWLMLLRWTKDQHARFGYNVRPAVHIVGEKLLSMVGAYSFSSSFHLYPRFCRYLEWLFESGLVAHWQSNVDGQRQYERRFTFFDSSIITFGDLTMIWLALAIGHSVAAMVFCVELLHRCLRLYLARRK